MARHPLTGRELMKLDYPPYTIDRSRFKPFDQRKNVFGRLIHDKNAPFYRRGLYDEIEKIIDDGRPGFSRVEFARVMGAWAVHDFFHYAFSWEPPSNPNSVMARPKLEKYIIEDTEAMTKMVKETARMYGADLVGICKLNNDWMYSHDLEGRKLSLPSNCRYVIVMAVRMELERLEDTPTFTAGTETALAYSKMAFIVACLAEFIRYLGYTAIPSGNDTALSIPLAVDAGLGELGRNGLLITPEYGPSVRICKVFTDMPLIPDKPLKFGVVEFCRSCKLCSMKCEAGAISFDDEASYRTVCPSNNEGVLRWAVDHDKCYMFWLENGVDCSKCIAVCPFARITVKRDES